MPYLWTRPRRRRAYGAAIWLMWLAVVAALWGVQRQSWIAYRDVPFLGMMPIAAGTGRQSSVFGLLSYLTIDRDLVDPDGVFVGAGDPSVVWQWDRAAVAWSAGITVGSALLAFGFVRLLAGATRLRGRCDECGYDLTALESARCPECGTMVHRRKRWWT